MESTGLYIHIPYCRNKCIYCDFYSGGSRIADWENYIACLLRELEIRREELGGFPSTLYLGGGTPSLIPGKQFLVLSNGILKYFNENKPKEFTIEINPEDVDKDSCELWVSAGVNRVSVGIQSMNDKELKFLGRNTTESMNFNSLELLSDYFANISVDIMFGIPGQTEKSYRQTLEKVIDFYPQHISSYSLMLEPGTALTHLVKKNKILLPDEELWMSLYDQTISYLENNKFQRYEISNFCKEGFESLHNSNYWRGKSYLGIGPAAHSYDGGRIRRANPSDLKEYLTFFKDQGKWSEKNEIHFYEEEILSENDLVEEMIMTRLRMKEGLSLTEFERKFGFEQMKNLLQKAVSFKNQGYLKEERDKLFFTTSGFRISDMIISSLF